MCVIVASQVGNKIDSETWDKCAIANQDGVGLAYFDKDGKIVSARSVKPEDIWAIYKDIEGPYVLHFRLATHGEVTDDNCHPFPLKTKRYIYGYLAHNGILSGYGSAMLSDTRDYIARKLQKHWQFWRYLPTKSQLKAIGKDIGQGNKFAILTPDRTLHIVNKHLGTDAVPEHPGIWFSNTNWKYSRRYSNSQLSDWNNYSNYSSYSSAPDQCELCGRYKTVHMERIENMHLLLCKECVKELEGVVWDDVVNAATPDPDELDSFMKERFLEPDGDDSRVLAVRAAEDALRDIELESEDYSEQSTEFVKHGKTKEQAAAELEEFGFGASGA